MIVNDVLCRNGLRRREGGLRPSENIVPVWGTGFVVMFRDGRGLFRAGLVEVEGSIRPSEKLFSDGLMLFAVGLFG
ncbi:hypothetical protein [Neisseria sp.]|uniref:hypothetical protein n=1 Tax=Neisseria sp. TaxID=192066 RepID=UPI0035A0D09D